MEITNKDVFNLRKEADNVEMRLNANQFEDSLKDRITAAIATMRDVARIWEEVLQKNRIEVAIESTEDYTEIEKNNVLWHPNEPQLDGIALEGFFGTWHPIACAELYGNPFYLMEHDTFGDDAACVIITRYGDVILDEVYNGFDDLWEYIESGYQEEVEVIKAGYPPKEYLVKALQRVNTVYQKELTVAELRTLYQKKDEPIERKGIVREAIQLFRSEELILEKKDLTMGNVNKRVFGQENCEELSL